MDDEKKMEIDVVWPCGAEVRFSGSKVDGIQLLRCIVEGYISPLTAEERKRVIEATRKG